MFAGAHSDAPTRVGDKRNGYRINKGLHHRCPIAWGRENDNRLPPDRISSHRRSGKKSETAARMDGHRRGAASGGPSPEGFLIKSFSRKSLIVDDIQEDMFAVTTLSASYLGTSPEVRGISCSHNGRCRTLVFGCTQ